jgi:transcriptional regulator with XRE-family HTH domain
VHPQRPAHATIGATVRQLRRQHGLSLRTLAERSGFSASFLSQVEADAVSPSISSLERIINQLGVTLGQFFSAIESAPRTIIRRDERGAYASAWSLTDVSVLADGAPGRRLSAVEATVAPGGASGKHARPSPQDTFLLLLSGALTITADGLTATLEAGDSAYFAEGAPFAWENRAEGPATLLIVSVTSTDGIGVIAGRPASDAPESDR